jgi:hypothetical protein
MPVILSLLPIIAHCLPVLTVVSDPLFRPASAPPPRRHPSPTMNHAPPGWRLAGAAPISIPSIRDDLVGQHRLASSPAANQPLTKRLRDHIGLSHEINLGDMERSDRHSPSPPCTPLPLPGTPADHVPGTPDSTSVPEDIAAYNYASGMAFGVFYGGLCVLTLVQAHAAMDRYTHARTHITLLTQTALYSPDRDEFPRHGPPLHYARHG